MKNQNTFNLHSAVRVTALVASIAILAGCAAEPEIEGIETEQPVATQEPESTPRAEPTVEVAHVFDEPWPLEFTKSQLESASFEAASAFFDGVRSAPGEPVILFADSVPANIRSILEEVASSSSEYLFPLIEVPVIFGYAVAENDAAVAELLATTGLQITIEDICGWDGKPGCVDWMELGWWPIQTTFWRKGAPRAELIANSRVIPHEWFHEVQFQKFSYDSSRVAPSSLGIGVWIYEGSATFVDRVITKKLGGQVNILEGCVDKDRPLAEHWQHDQSAYYLGAFATAYIVASIGFQPLLDFFVEARNDRNWPAAFERAIGISLDDFYDKFEKVRPNINLPAC